MSRSPSNGSAGSSEIRAPLVRAVAAALSSVLLAGCLSLPGPETGRGGNDIYNGKAWAGGGAFAQGGVPATLDEALRMAYSNHPGLRAAFERWKAAEERVPQAASLENPSLSFDYYIEQTDTRYGIGLTQMVPAFGKRGWRRNRAVAEAERAGHLFEAERLLLKDRVVRSFHEYYFLSQAIAITEEKAGILSDLESVLATRYRTASEPFAGMVRIAMEKARIASDLESLLDERVARSAGLAALLNLPESGLLPWPAVSWPEKDADLSLEPGALPEDGNPEMEAAAAMIAAETSQEQLARLGFLPDFMLGARLMMMPGMDGQGDSSDVGLMVGLSIPVWGGRVRAEAREAAFLAHAARQERENLRNRLRAEWAMARFRLRDAQRRMDLLSQSLIPSAVRIRDVAEKEFMSGQADYMAWMDAHLAALDLRLQWERAAVDREIARSELRSLAGISDPQQDVR